MKLFTKFMWALLPLIGMMLAVSCDNSGVEEPKDDPTPTEKPVIKLKQSELTAEAEGGEYSVNYTIVNPIDGVMVEATCAAEWIKDIDVTVAGAIRFVVSQNEVEEPREASVKVTYEDADEVSFVVKQLAAAPASYTFTVELLSCNYFEAFIDVYPANLDTKYLIGIYSMEEVEEYGLHDDDALFQEDMAYKEWIGSWSGLSAMDVAREDARQGAVYDLRLANLSPASEYLFYAFYYDVNTGERLSDVFRFEFSTPSVELGELSFDVDTEITGPVVDVVITPNNYSGAYYFDMLAKSLVDSEAAALGITPEQYIEKWWVDVTESDRLQGAPPALIIQNHCSYDTDTFTFELLADTDYYVFAFAVNDYALCSTVPYMEVVHTGIVESSDMSIRIVVSDITAYGVTFVFRPTSDSESYVAGWVTLEEWNELGASERARLSAILKKYDFEYIYGEYQYDIDRGLEPDTEYVVYAFGYYGGVVTTSLFSQEFKTLPEKPSEVTVSIKDMGYFDIRAVNELDPTIGNLDMADEYAVYPVEFVVSDPDAVVYYYNWEVGPYDDPAWYTDENLLGRMLYWDVRPMYICEPVAYDYENWLGAIAKDELGFYSERFLYKFQCTREGVNPDAQIFVDWYNEHRDIIANTQSVVYSCEPLAIEPMEAPFRAAVSTAERTEGERYSQRDSVESSAPIKGADDVVMLQHIR